MESNAVQNTDSPLRNALAERAYIFSTVERLLRKVTTQGKTISLRGLIAHPDLHKYAKNDWRVRTALDYLEDNGFVIVTHDESHKRRKQYQWDIYAPPFSFTAKLERESKRKPSEPVVQTFAAPVKKEGEFVKLDPALLPTEPEHDGDIELVMGGTTIIAKGGTTIVVGRNEGNGRMRVTIE